MQDLEKAPGTDEYQFIDVTGAIAKRIMQTLLDGDDDDDGGDSATDSSDHSGGGGSGSGGSPKKGKSKRNSLTGMGKGGKRVIVKSTLTKVVPIAQQQASGGGSGGGNGKKKGKDKGKFMDPSSSKTAARGLIMAQTSNQTRVVV